jgi:hypothetical protein
VASSANNSIKLTALVCLCVFAVSISASADEDSFSLSSSSSPVNPFNQISPFRDANPAVHTANEWSQSSSDSSRSNDLPLPENFNPNACKPYFDQIKKAHISYQQAENALSHMPKEMAGAGAAVVGIAAVATLGVVAIAGAALSPLLIAGMAIGAVVAGVGVKVYLDTDSKEALLDSCILYASRFGMNLNVSHPISPMITSNTEKHSASAASDATPQDPSDVKEREAK